MKRILFILHLLYAVGIHSQTDFNDALNQASEKHFNDAIISFEKIAQKNQENISVYYNLGNCYYHVRRYGDAIWAYEKVLKYHPLDIDVIKNLELCYKKLGSNHFWQPHLSGLQQLILTVGSNTWSYLSLFFSAFFAYCLFMVLRKNTVWRRPILILATGSLLLLFAAMACAYSSYNQLTNSYFAIITKHNTPVFFNENGLKSIFKLSEGAKVAIIEKKANNYLIQMENGQTFLVHSKDIRLI